VGKRAILWATVGAAGVAAALVAKPGTYDWLMRVSGRRSDRHHYETDVAESIDDEALDEEANELRLSLRARLAESQTAPEVGDVVEANAMAAGQGAADGGEQSAVDDARARVRAKAREARKRLTDAAEDAT
jgi:hypothetical protein